MRAKEFFRGMDDAASVSERVEHEFLYSAYKAARDTYMLDDDNHGPRHWRRVMENGVFLSQSAGGDAFIVRLFAIFHDCQRIEASGDDNHGIRAATFVMDYLGMPLLNTYLSRKQLATLILALSAHTYAMPDEAIMLSNTVKCCIDADRLDFSRIGEPTDRDFLFLPESASMIHMCELKIQEEEKEWIKG